MLFPILIVLLPVILVSLFSLSAFAAPASGPLKVHPRNPRYFADGSGKAILLVGSHTWNNLVDIADEDPPQPFDFDAYLDFLREHNHNFIRLWTWELASSTWKGSHNVSPLPWQRTGPGSALDGKPRFDLERFDQAYFDRIRQRVQAAGRQGIYVSVMLFEGWGLQFAEDPWSSHPLNKANNVNGMDGDPAAEGNGLAVHDLSAIPPEALAVQETLVRRVVDTVNDLDNVLYEVSNEAGGFSADWQYHIIRVIREYEAGRPMQHPVGMTFAYKGGTNAQLFDSPADWISPNPDGGYRDEPPAADGGKVVINDTDHLWGIGGNRQWMWRSVCSGLNPIYMDVYDTAIYEGEADVSLRKNMGYALALSQRLDLASMTPQGHLASTGCCLAGPAPDAGEYLVYLPDGGPVDVDLSAASGTLRSEWLNPETGETVEGREVKGGAPRRFSAPFPGDAVLYLTSR